MSRINSLFLVLAAVLVVGFAAPTTQAVPCTTVGGNLVVNCGFETGSFSSWTQSGNIAFTAVDNGTFIPAFTPTGGTFQGHFGPVATMGFLSQTIATAPGAYTLSFWLANSSGPTNSFSVSFGGVVVASSVLVDAAAFPYTFYTFSVVATGPSSVLQFAFRQDPGYWFLDDVVLTPSGPGAIPEPATLLLLGTGLAGVAAKIRKRRQMRS